jgi:hypothetical protein
MEHLIYNSPVIKESIQQLKNSREIEAHITRFNIRHTDLFFNSRFESGNLK